MYTVQLYVCISTFVCTHVSQPTQGKASGDIQVMTAVISNKMLNFPEWNSQSVISGLHGQHPNPLSHQGS